MGRFRRTMTGLAVAAAVTVGAAGCSDDKRPAASPATTAVATTPTTVARAAGSDPFCAFLATLNERFGRIDTSLVDPQSLKVVMQDATRAAQQAEGSAPPAIRSDVTVLNQGLQRLLNVFQQVNFDVRQLTLAHIQELYTPAVVAAGERIEAYTAQNCA